MAEDNTSSMGLDDLNSVHPNNSRPSNDSEPDPVSGSYPTNSDNWLGIREVVRIRDRLRSLWSQSLSPLEPRNVAMESTGGGEAVSHRNWLPPFWRQLVFPRETRTLEPESGDGRLRHRLSSLWRQPPNNPLQTRNITRESTGEEISNGQTKPCETCSGNVEDNTLCKKDGAGKNNDGECSFFDCNICLELAKDPVVTCCGHLYCWQCIYRWLSHNSRAKKCPVCNGVLTTKDVTPIYGRGGNNNAGGGEPSISLDEIPQRPQALRIEREMFMELTSGEMARAFRFARGIEFTSISVRRINHSQAQAAPSSSPESAMNSVDELNPASAAVAAALSSERQTIHDGVGIDSTVALSASSSRRRNDSDSEIIGDSRENRRRLNSF